MRRSHIDILKHRVRPLIENVCEKFKDLKPGFGLINTWKFGQTSLGVVLEKSSWSQLLSFMEAPAGLTYEHARKIRTDSTLSEHRKDYRDRHMLCQSPTDRIASNKFREDGLLLPFGYPRDGFQEINP